MITDGFTTTSWENGELNDPRLLDLRYIDMGNFRNIVFFKSFNLTKERKMKQKQTYKVIPQGDCILVALGYELSIAASKITNIPKEAKVQKTPLLLKGTTNSHAIYGKSKVYKLDTPLYGIDTFLKVEGDSILNHVKCLSTFEPAEHLEQIVPKGLYLVQPLMEHDHIANEQRRVID